MVEKQQKAISNLRPSSSPVTAEFERDEKQFRAYNIVGPYK